MTDQSTIIQNKKSELRNHFRIKLRSLFADEDFHKKKSQEAIEKILELQEFHSAKNIALYHPLPDELNLLGLVKRSHELNIKKTFVLPRAIGDGKILFFEFRELSDLKVEKYGIKVPKATNRFFKARDLDFIIVPGLAFDKRFYRLGRGAAYYDRLLDQLGTQNTYSLSIAIEEQVLESLPTESTDIVLKKLIII
jgi:5-formyltetrahydrofolate cyclo-ligase